MRAYGACLELRDQRSGALDVCRPQSAFNSVAVEPPYCRLSKPRLCECLDRRGKVGRGGPRVAGRELGETDCALPQHAPDRLADAAGLERGGAYRIDAAVVRVDVRAPNVARVHTDARQLKELVHPVAKRGGTAPVTRPALEQGAVEQNVGERRLVALVERRTLRKLEVAASAGEVVDVAEPLAELERDARVDRHGGRRGSFELERALRPLAVETVAEEEVGADSR